MIIVRAFIALTMAAAMSCTLRRLNEILKTIKINKKKNLPESEFQKP